MRKLILISLGLLAALTAFGQRTLRQWVTTADGASLYAPGDEVVFSDARGDRSVPIIVDPRQSYQEMLGFGFSLTGGSAELLMKMDASARTRILTELFGQDPGQLDISVVRLTVGASDMNSFVFSYDDMPEGKTDWDLKHFSLSQDLKDVVPVMQEILSIHPDIWVMASPWSAPAWMKEKYDVRGPKLRRDCYDVYARYLAKYIVEMGKKGIHIDALTIQNEPLNSRNTPSMPWSPEDQKVFIRDYLGPQFDRQGIATDILLFDHNCDRPDYPIAILEDPKAASYAAGSAFHHYMGDLSAMTQMHDYRPDKDIYFTEQMVVDRSGGPVTAQIAKYVGMGILGFAAYYVILRVLLLIQGKELASYQGIGEAGMAKEGLVSVVKSIYFDFVGFTLGGGVFFQNVFSLDYDPKVISGLQRILKKKGIANVTPKVADMLSTGLPDNFADLVLMSQVLHHAQDPRLALKEAIRILKPGGTLALLDLAQHKEESFRETHGHIWLGFDRAQLEFFVKEFNCKIVESEIIPSENQVDKKLPVICMILTKE